MVGKVTRSVGVSLPTTNFPVKTCLKLIELWLSNRSYFNGYIRLQKKIKYVDHIKYFALCKNLVRDFKVYFLSTAQSSEITKFTWKTNFVCVIFYSDWKITIWLNSLLFFSFDLGEIIAIDYKTPYVLITPQ